MRYADSLPIVTDDDVVAEIIEIESGKHVDSAWNMDTAINYIQDTAHLAVAVAPILWNDGSVRLTIRELQDAFDYERRLQEDCFNLIPVRMFEDA